MLFENSLHFLLLNLRLSDTTDSDAAGIQGIQSYRRKSSDFYYEKLIRAIRWKIVSETECWNEELKKKPCNLAAISFHFIFFLFLRHFGLFQQHW